MFNKWLDAVVDYMPSPLDIPAIKGLMLIREEDGKTLQWWWPMSALAFKIATDPFVGKLAFTRVYSGVMKAGTYVLNSTKVKKKELVDLLKCMLTIEKKLKNYMQVN